jgi:hypothetical protein
MSGEETRARECEVDKRWKREEGKGLISYIFTKLKAK